RLDLFSNELVGIDGTKIKAVNSRTRNFNAENLESRINSGYENLIASANHISIGALINPGGQRSTCATCTLNSMAASYQRTTDPHVPKTRSGVCRSRIYGFASKGGKIMK
ncbi:MAG: hypothetical protein ACP5NC_08245, partial [Nitrososphaeria archaeon]